MKTSTKNNHFTVLIPTRERCDTLTHTLHTCVIQGHDDLEILVSDNFSQDGTREVVESYKDPRIRYVNTGKRLSMTENFEFALSHVPPKGYVICVGDDDGLLPNGIRDVNAVIVETGARVLRWDSAFYRWPVVGYRDTNQLFIPSLGSRLTTRNSATTIQNVLSFKASYASLPLLYMRSAIEYDVIRRIKDLSGRFYHSMAPDVYSGFAIAGSVDSFMNSERPYVIGGSSHHSIGASGDGLGPGTPAQKFLNETNLPFHSSLLFCNSTHQAVLESFFQARDHLPFFRNFTVDMEKLVCFMMKEAAPRAPDDYMAIKDAVVHLGKVHNVSKAAQRAIAASPKRDPDSTRRLTVRNFGRAGLEIARLFAEDLRNGSFCLNCSSLNVRNIFDASFLCDNILRLKDMSIIGHSWSRVRTGLQGAVTTLREMTGNRTDHEPH
jgi:hypothetical protein